MKKFIAMLSAVVFGMLAAHVGLAQTLVVSPSKLKLEGTQYQGATAATIGVYNGARSGTSYITLAVPTDDTWLSVSPSTAISTGEVDSVTVTFVTTNLTAGWHTSAITIVQTNAPVTTKTIDVYLKILEDENLGIAIGPGSVATHASGIAIGNRVLRSVAIGPNCIAIGGVVNEVSNSILIGTNRWTF